MSNPFLKHDFFCSTYAAASLLRVAAPALSFFSILIWHQSSFVDWATWHVKIVISVKFDPDDFRGFKIWISVIRQFTGENKKSQTCKILIWNQNCKAFNFWHDKFAFFSPANIAFLVLRRFNYTRRGVHHLPSILLSQPLLWSQPEKHRRTGNLLLSAGKSLDTVYLGKFHAKALINTRLRCCKYSVSPAIDMLR